MKAQLLKHTQCSHWCMFQTSQQLSVSFEGISFLPSIMLTPAAPPNTHLNKTNKKIQHNLLAGVDT